MEIKAFFHVNLFKQRKYLFIVFIFFFCLKEKLNCTQTDYFGIFDVDYRKVEEVLLLFEIFCFSLKYFNQNKSEK